MTALTWSAVAQIQPDRAPEQRVSPSRGHMAATWSGVMPTVSVSWRQRLPLPSSLRSAGGAALAGPLRQHHGTPAQSVRSCPPSSRRDTQRVLIMSAAPVAVRLARRRAVPQLPAGVPSAAIARTSRDDGTTLPRIAIAALRPGMPLTPPPRRAPAPPRCTLAMSVSVPQAPASASSSANGQARSRWKMLPRGQRQLVLEVERRLGLEARLAVRPAQQAVLDRLGEHRVERPQRGLQRLASPPPVPCSNSRAGVCSANSVSVCGGRRRAEDARVGQRVAVDLARQRRRHAAARSPPRTRSRAGRRSR